MYKPKKHIDAANRIKIRAADTSTVPKRMELWARSKQGLPDLKNHGQIEIIGWTRFH